MSEQRRARQRRREERRAARTTTQEPQERSFLQNAQIWLQDNWIKVAGGAVGVVLVAVLGYAVYTAAITEDSTLAEEAEQAEQDDSPDIPGEFHESAGRQHVNEDVDYNTDPPTSGPHNPVPLPSGVYRDPEQAPEERAVHAMEHASAIIWYNCEAGELDEDECTAFVDELRDKYESLLTGQSGGALLIINRPEMEHFIALTSWTRLLELDEFDEDALDEFLDANRCRFDPEGFCE
jgi:Protein of unknown function (DUF3105)